jgi:hypothetical protein
MADSPKESEAISASILGAPGEYYGHRLAKRRKYGGRKKGTRNKLTLEKLRAAEQEIAAARGAKKLAIEHMDDMLEYFRNLVRVLSPWDADGTPRPDRDQKLWFRTVEVFKDFLALRATYQSPRLSAVAIVPQAPQQRTVVNVTILDGRGEKVYSDVPEDEDTKLIDGSLGEPR